MIDGTKVLHSWQNVVYTTAWTVVMAAVCLSGCSLGFSLEEEHAVQHRYTGTILHTLWRRKGMLGLPFGVAMHSRT